jgi:hypothetical protein
MLMYRIEHKIRLARDNPKLQGLDIGEGPYYRFSYEDTVLRRMMFELAEDDSRPTPHIDKKIASHVLKEPDAFHVPGEFIFGFETLAKLRWWFMAPELRTTLTKSGYGISIYNGTVFHGDTQSVLNTTFGFSKVITSIPFKEAKTK